MSAGNPFLSLPDAPQQQGQSGNPFDSLPDAPAAPAKKGFWQSAWEDVKGLVPQAQNPYPGMGVDQKVAAADASSQRDQSRKDAGYNLPYRLTAPVAESVGVNVSGMEDAAKKGDTAGVLGHTVVPVAALAAGEAVAHAPDLPGVSAVTGPIKRAFSKGAVTQEMAGKLHTSLDQIASDAGLPPSTETSLSGKTTDIVSGLKKQAQVNYSQLDQASGGRYQRFRDEIDSIQNDLQSKYLDRTQKAAAQKDLANVQQEYAAVQQELIAKGVDPNTIKAADAKWAQAKALEQTGKQFRKGETLSGELKPGTTSIDTGLKNQKPHILPQAAKGEAGNITSAVTDATQGVRNVGRNRKIAAGAGAVLGLSGVAKYGNALTGH